MKNQSKIIALTGGIGSGKSTALNILKDAGFLVLSSDKIVLELYKKRKVRKKLKAIFPNAVSGFFLTLDKKKIAEETFNDSEKHRTLTDTVTPLVLKEIIKRSKKINRPVFCEVPLLFECKFESFFDGIIVIKRDLAARIESVKTRSNLSNEEILSRIKKQVDYDAIDLSPYTVIYNDQDYFSLKEKVLSVAKSYT